MWCACDQYIESPCGFVVDEYLYSNDLIWKQGIWTIWVQYLISPSSPQKKWVWFDKPAGWACMIMYCVHAQCTLVSMGVTHTWLKEVYTWCFVSNSCVLDVSVYIAYLSWWFCQMTMKTWTGTRLAWCLANIHWQNYYPYPNTVILSLKLFMMYVLETLMSDLYTTIDKIFSSCNWDGC